MTTKKAHVPRTRIGRLVNKAGYPDYLNRFMTGLVYLDHALRGDPMLSGPFEVRLSREDGIRFEIWVRMNIPPHLLDDAQFVTKGTPSERTTVIHGIRFTWPVERYALPSGRPMARPVPTPVNFEDLATRKPLYPGETICVQIPKYEDMP